MPAEVNRAESRFAAGFEGLLHVAMEQIIPHVDSGIAREPD
jgi:hypothetical protein